MIAVVVLGVIFSVGIAGSMKENAYAIIVAIAVLMIVGLFLAMWLFFIPYLAGKTFVEDRTRDFMAKDFKTKYDKKYFLIYLVACIVLCFAVLIVGIFTGLIMFSTMLGNYDESLITTAGILVGTPASILAYISFAASLIYAYLSWLKKANLEGVGVFFNIPLKAEYASQIKEGETENGNSN